MSIIGRIASFMYPEHCVRCGELVGDDRKSPFCERCGRMFENEKLRARSENLGQPVAEFGDGKNRERFGLVCFLADYVPGKSLSATDTLIWRLKRNATRDLLDFISGEMAELIRQEAAEHLRSVRPEDVIVTNVPRRPKTILEVGYDHMADVASLTAKKLGYRYAKLLGRTGKALEQKTLGHEERLENAKNTITVREKDLAGKTVILMDDIMTTGASLASSAELLTGAGAEMIISATIARTHAHG